MNMSNVSILFATSPYRNQTDKLMSRLTLTLYDNTHYLKNILVVLAVLPSTVIATLTSPRPIKLRDKTKLT